MIPLTKQHATYFFILIAIAIVYWNFSLKYTNYDSTNTSHHKAQLKSIYRNLHSAYINQKPPSTEVMSQISTLLQEPEATTTTITDIVDSNNQKISLCPEKWIPKKDYPYFLTNWETENCSNASLINEIITILLYDTTEKNDVCFNETISGLLHVYPNITILLAVFNSSSCKETWPLNVKKVVVNQTYTPGQVWNTLISKVNTKTILIGRHLNMYLPLLSPLERLLRVITSDPQIKIAGGSIRNRTGHWLIGCFQSRMFNYILQYDDGYYRSKNECMYCNYLISPFVTYTTLLQDVTFDETLQENCVFEDLFLRIIQKNYLVVNCPDVMFLADENWTKKESVKKSWIQLATKWNLNKVRLPNSLHSYTCKEVKISCKNIAKKTSSFLIPICCVEQLAKAVHFFHDFAVENNLRYELQAGSVLGVVKMYDFMPWDLDGDFIFLASNASFYQNSTSKFKKKGFKLGDFKIKYKDPYFQLYSPDLRVEMWGYRRFASDRFYPQIFLSNPTKVLFHGKWINGPINPGSYSRNRYGIEMLKHSHNWSQLKFESSWVPYSAGYFKKCIEPTNHACLDKFNADGNIQFKVPNEKMCHQI